MRRPLRQIFAFALAAATACASQSSIASRPGAPSPEDMPDSLAAPESHPPIPVPPAVSLADSLLERRLSQDSAADVAILEELEAATPPDSSQASQNGDPLDALSESRLSGLDLTTYADHHRVRYYLDFFQGPARSRMAVWLQRMPVYEGMIRDRFQAAGLPPDLVYLGLIESGFSNIAVSRSRAVGMWQFMRGTGRWMGLKIDRWVDERRDPIKATDAAARYLSYLTQEFSGSYYLAAAAYNAGPGRVSRGLSRLGTAAPGGSAEEGEEEEEDGLSDEHFFSLADSRYIRKETKDYVPKLIAASLIGRNPDAYGFPPAPPAQPYPRDSLVVHEMTGLDVIARLAGVPPATIRELNAQYLRRATPPRRTSVVRLPEGTQEKVTLAYAALPTKERAGASAARLAEVDAAEARARTHVVKSGETLGGIAERYKTSVSNLRRMNGLGKSSLIRAGQRLKVPGGKGSAVAQSSGERPAVHVVRRGDTLYDLARRYGVTVQALMDANDMSSSKLRAGQKLKIPA